MRWIVVAVIIVIGLIAVARPSNQAATTSEQVAASPTVIVSSGPKSSFGDGTYRVGSDIEHGTYRAEGNLCYWERLRGFSGQNSDIIANGNPSGPIILTIDSGDAGFTTRRCGTWEKQ